MRSPRGGLFLRLHKFQTLHLMLKLSASEQERVAPSGELHQPRTFVGELRSTHQACGSTASPPRVLGTIVSPRFKPTTKSPPICRHGQAQTQQVHWERCHGTLEREDFIANIFDVVDVVYNTADKVEFLAELVTLAKSVVAKASSKSLRRISLRFRRASRHRQLSSSQLQCISRLAKISLVGTADTLSFLSNRTDRDVPGHKRLPQCRFGPSLQVLPSIPFLHMRSESGQQKKTHRQNPCDLNTCPKQHTDTVSEGERTHRVLSSEHIPGYRTSLNGSITS